MLGNNYVNQLKSLVNSRVSLFDRNGGCVNIHLKYITDWWNDENEVRIMDLTKSGILVVDKNKKKAIIPLSKLCGIDFDQRHLEFHS